MDRHGQIEWAIGRRCAGHRLARCPTAADWRRDAAVASAIALASLRRSHTTDALVAAAAGKAPGEAWLGRRGALPLGRRRNVAIERDAAYWQRLQALLGAPLRGA